MTKMTKPAVGGLAALHSGRSIWWLVGRRMRARRAQLGYVVDRVAEELGISPTVYASYESGEAQAPELLLAQLAELLDVPALWFFQDAPFAEKKEEEDCDGSPRAYRIATPEQRIGFLADSFRRLDLEGQQQLLAIADALSRTNGKRSRE